MKINSHWSVISRRATSTQVNRSGASSSPPKLRGVHGAVLRAATRIGCITVSLLLLSFRSFAQPTIPMEWFYFPPSFDTTYGSTPIAYTTNLLSVPVDVPDGDGANALILDTTNLTPAYLEYAVTDTNAVPNFNYDPGTVLFYFSPNWASVSQGGTGPGQTAYFLGSGDWSSGSPNGLFIIYADSCGSNIFVAGVGEGVTNIYASAAIAWTSNTFHQIGVEWSGDGNRFHPGIKLYLDGTLAATGIKLSIVPETEYDSNGFSTNGLFVGSDNNGGQQMRGAMWSMITWSDMYGGWYTEGWPYMSNALAAWQSNLEGGAFGAMMGMGVGMAANVGSLNPTNGGCGCITNTNVFLTNIAAELISGSNMTFSFTIEGGTSGMAYNVYSTTNLWMTNITDAVWTLLGQGTNCGTYSVTNQPMNQTFYLLGGNQPGHTKDYVFVVYAQPITSTGDLGTCPGPYAGYINYLPTNGAWGFTPLTNTTVFTASDTTRTNTRVEYVGAYGDSGCAQTTVTIPNPPFSPAYRFAIYFTNNVPSTNYPIALSGFSP